MLILIQINMGEILTGDKLVPKKEDAVTYTKDDTDYTEITSGGYKTTTKTYTPKIGVNTKLVEKVNYTKPPSAVATTPKEGSLEGFTSISKKTIDDYDFTPEKRTQVLGNMSKGMTLGESIVGVAVDKALKVLDLSKYNTDEVPKDLHAMNIDTTFMGGQIRAAKLDPETELRYLKANNVLKNAQNKGFRVLRSKDIESGENLYWLESDEGGVKKYSLNGLLEVKEIVDLVYGEKKEEVIPEVIPDEVTPEITPEEDDVIIDDDGEELPADFTPYEFSTAEKWYGAAILTDVTTTFGGLALKPFAGAGSVVSLLGGISSIGMEAYADYLSGKSTWDIVKNASVRTGLEAVEAVSFAPASLIHKFRTGGMALNLVKKVMHGAMIVNVGATAIDKQNKEIYEKLNKDGVSSLTIDDWRQIGRVLTAAMAGGSAVHTQATMGKNLRRSMNKSAAGTPRSEIEATVEGSSKLKNFDPKVEQKLVKKGVKKTTKDRSKIRETRDAEVKKIEGEISNVKINAKTSRSEVGKIKFAKHQEIKKIKETAGADIKANVKKIKTEAAAKTPTLEPRVKSRVKTTAVTKLQEKSRGKLSKEQRKAEQDVSGIFGYAGGKRRINRASEKTGTPTLAQRSEVKSARISGAEGKHQASLDKNNKRIEEIDVAVKKASDAEKITLGKEKDKLIAKNKVVTESLGAAKTKAGDLDTKKSIKSAELKRETATDKINVIKKKLKGEKDQKVKDILTKQQNDLKKEIKDLDIEIKDLGKKGLVRRGAKKSVSVVNNAIERLSYNALPNDRATVQAALKSLSLSNISIAGAPIGKGNKHKIYKDDAALNAYLTKVGYKKSLVEVLSNSEKQDLMRFVIYYKGARPPLKREGGVFDLLIPRKVRKAQTGIETAVYTPPTTGVSSYSPGVTVGNPLNIADKLIEKQKGVGKSWSTEHEGYYFVTKEGYPLPAGQQSEYLVHDSAPTVIVSRENVNVKLWDGKPLESQYKAFQPKGTSPLDVPKAVYVTEGGEVSSTVTEWITLDDKQDRIYKVSPGGGVSEYKDVPIMGEFTKGKVVQSLTNVLDVEPVAPITTTSTTRTDAEIARINTANNTARERYGLPADPDTGKRKYMDILKYIQPSDFAPNKIIEEKYTKQHLVPTELASSPIRDMPYFDEANSRLSLTPRIDTADYLVGATFNRKTFNDAENKRQELVAKNAEFINNQRRSALDIQNKNKMSIINTTNQNYIMDNQMAEKTAQSRLLARQQDENRDAKKYANITNGIAKYTRDLVENKQTTKDKNAYNKLAQQRYTYKTEWEPRILALMNEGKFNDATVLKTEFANQYKVHPDFLIESMLNTKGGTELMEAPVQSANTTTTTPPL